MISVIRYTRAIKQIASRKRFYTARLSGLEDRPSVQPRGGALTVVRRAIIDDPKYAPGRPVRLLTHDLRDQAVERGNSGLLLTAAEQFGAMDVPGSDIGPSTGVGVFAHRSAANVARQCPIQPSKK
jgi:hypothetical protein